MSPSLSQVGFAAAEDHARALEAVELGYGEAGDLREHAARVLPDAVPGVDPKPDNYSVPDHQFDPAAFVAPPFGRYGNVGRNTLRAPGFAQVDLSLIKNTRIANTHSVQIRFEVFNAFNRANFAAPFSGLNRDPITNSLSPSAAFGQSFSTVGDELGGLLGAGGPRQMQIAVRYTF